MEGSPPSPITTEKDSSNEKKESRKSKKKEAEKLGSLIVEAKPERDQDEQAKKTPEKPESVWQRLTREEKEAEKEPEKSPLGERNTDKTPELDGEAPLEHLSVVEVEAVNQNLARVRHEEVVAELEEAETGAAEAFEAEAAETFLAKAEATGDPEGAFDETLAEYGLAIEELPAVVEAGEALTREDAPEASDEAIIDMTQPAEGEVPLMAGGEAIPDGGAEDDDPASTAAPASGSTIAVPAAGGGSGVAGTGGGSGAGFTGGGGAGRGAGGGGVPPRGPGGMPPFGGLPPTPPGAGGPGGYNWMPPYGAGVAAPNAAPAANPNMISNEDALYYERRAQMRGLLVGGIVGYLIGRRRGRIKAEKRLLPVQKKLEKEVTSLQEQLYFKEEAIRRAAARQNRQRPAIERAALRDKIRPERSVNTRQRPAAIEANQLHGKQLPPERIGKVLIAAEALPAGRVANRSGREAIPAAKADRRAETMSRNELLKLSEKITVEGTSLRQVYETHLVGERGLRRLVAEHLRGGDVKEVLRQEIIEREIDFERDPVMRDRARASMSGGGAAALNTLLRQAGAMPTEDEGSLSIPKGSAEDRRSAAEAAAKQRRQRVADVALVGTILVLIAIIVLLLIVRG